MRVFVTGAAGFVGTRLSARLRDAGHEPVGIDVEHDVTSLPAIGTALGEIRPDAIIHLAALSSVPESFGDPMATFRVNFLGTRNLLAAVASEAPTARVLYVGSGDAYGPAAAGAPPFRESDPLAPRSPYAWTKATAEGLATRAARDGLDVVRIRPFNHTGAGQTDRFVVPSFARQVAEIAAGVRAPTMAVGNLESQRDFLDVDDVLSAYLALLDPRVPATVYNVASGRGTRIQEVLDQLLELAGVAPEVRLDPARHRPTDSLVGDSSRLREATGWAPRIPFGDTLAALLDGWREQISATATPGAP